MKRKAALLTTLLIILLLFIPACSKRHNYPETKKDTVTDNYFGTVVADPYRWLEDADSNETIQWVEKQNQLTEKYLSKIPQREKLKKRLTQLWDYERLSLPTKEGGLYFYWKNTGLQNQAVLFLKESLDGKETELLNPNTLSEDGTVSVTGISVSKDASYLAYNLSKSGSDWQTIHIRDIKTKEDCPEIINHCRFSTAAWTNDNKGFYYNRFPDPNTVAEEDQSNYCKVYYHKLGTDQSKDELIYEDLENKELGFVPIITEDGKYLLLYVYHGTDERNRIYYRPVSSNGNFIKLLDNADARYNPIGNIKTTFYFDTDNSAPKGRVIAIDIKKPEPENWKEIIPQTDDTLDNVAIINNQFVTSYMHNVHNELKIFNLDGSFDCDIALPTIGTTGGFTGKQADTETFLYFTSFLFPGTNYRYDFKARKLTIFEKPDIDFDPSKYTTSQIFYPSKDGTRVPMFITHKKDMILDSNNPTLLYAYGGFNISIKPRFSIPTIVWLEMGGVHAVANIRGGGEFGESWHSQGQLANKQNVFDDFCSAAEYLIKEKYTSNKKIAILGGSNGGLLTAACMLQRPELFGAIVSHVPVIDMLRYHKFTVGRYWIPEYGCSEENEEQFKYLYAYSPLHNVKPNKDYPPILITSADTDDRVVPLHSKKFAATLQEINPQNLTLLRVETKAGHGGGKPLDKVISEIADTYSFLFGILD